MTSLTGMASTLLPHGRTMHSFYKLPVEYLDKDSSLNIRQGTKHAEKMINTHVHMLDEGSMISGPIIEVIDTGMQNLCNDRRLFGGRIFLITGDLGQLLPIIPRGSRNQIVNNCITRSSIWKEFHVHQLTQNMRTEPAEKEFAKWLLTVAHATIAKVPNKPNHIELPLEMITHDEDALIEHVYPQR
jgi:ATP-dependent DNA helicase PIF1